MCIKYLKPQYSSHKLVLVECITPLSTNSAHFLQTSAARLNLDVSHATLGYFSLAQSCYACHPSCIRTRLGFQHTLCNLTSHISYFIMFTPMSKAYVDSRIKLEVKTAERMHSETLLISLGFYFIR